MKRQKRVLVFQHVPVETPGVFLDFLAEDGHTSVAVELDAGEPIPPLAGFDALWVMGGPMDVWQTDAHPWLATELAAIREAVMERRMPYIGFCLGHQLLAAALGGTVGPGTGSEVGVLPVHSVEADTDGWFRGLPDTLEVLQWHSAAVHTLPPGARTLLGSDVCPIQAFHVGTHALGMQFHVEITGSSIRDWFEILAYREALIAALGEDGADALEREVDSLVPAFNQFARKIYLNWGRLSGFSEA